MVGALPTDVRDNPTIKQLKNFPDAMQMLLNAERTLGKKRLEAPAEDWDDAKYDLLYAELGRPAEASGYDIGEPDLSELRDDNQAAAKAQLESMLPAFHEAGLHSRQVRKIIGAAVKNHVSTQARIDEAIKTRAEGTRRELEKEYGAAYNTKIEAGHGAARELLGDEFEPFRHVALADGSYVLDHPTMVRFFALLGDLMEEGGVTPGAPGGRATMTPAEAKAERNRLRSDPEFRKMWLDRDPQHKEATNRMMNLRRMMREEG
jgi:hypothetical protein